MIGMGMAWHGIDMKGHTEYVFYDIVYCTYIANDNRAINI